jgi:hypothetical protein
MADSIYTIVEGAGIRDTNPLAPLKIPRETKSKPAP